MIVRRGVILVALAVILIELTESKDKKAAENKVCPRKEHLIGSRKCKKMCNDDSDCKGSRKRCVCDDVCGLTCLNPRGRCPKPSILNGKVRLDGRNQLGTVATYTCRKGYKLHGVETRICNGDREWSGVAPRCVPDIEFTYDKELRDPVRDVPQNIQSGVKENIALCPEPPSVMFADHNGPKQIRFTSGSEVRYACRQGFRMDGINMAKCLTSGQWAGPVMTCHEIICQELGDISNGRKFGDPPYKMNNKINYECAKGYRLKGSPSLTCGDTGTWSSHKPRCEKASTSCQRFKAPRHGIKIGRSVAIGSVVTVVCDPGYKLKGTMKRVCQQDATWSGIEPECEPIDCGPPGHLHNGYIEGRRYTYGSVIRYRCLDGAKFDGLTVSATCLETGQWSFPPPRCLSGCHRPDILNAELFVGDSPAPLLLDHGQQLTVKCNQGLGPNTSTKPICNNGTWGSLPSCKQGGCNNRPKEILNGLALYRGTREGDHVRYMCNTGYKLVGSKYLRCEGGDWKGNPPKCQPVFCPHPGDLKNGKILLVGDIGKFEYRPYVRQAGQGEKIEYYCSAGYRLDGPTAATCIDGQWSPEKQPKCTDSRHPMLPDSQELLTT